MTNTTDTKITVQVNVQASIDQVWNVWTLPEHITQWNNASPDWHTPNATNDLTVGGKFLYRMEAKDGTVGFDFDGTYLKVIPHELISYQLGDNRVVEIHFIPNEDGSTSIIETFEMEHENARALQEAGWQAILNNMKHYTENEQISSTKK